MIYLNIKNKWKIFLTIFIGNVLLINTSVHSCEDLKYEEAIIWIETQSKTKEKIVVELADTPKKGNKAFNAVIKFLSKTVCFLFGKEQITEFFG